MQRIALALLAVAAGSIGFAGCSNDDADAAGTVDVTLSDFAIKLSDSSVPAGEVTFQVENKGPSVHEFVVFKTDLAPDALPTDATGDVAESDEFAPVDEIEDIAKGASPELKVDLAAGDYVLVCNVPAHYRQGMRAAFTVT